MPSDSSSPSSSSPSRDDRRAFFRSVSLFEGAPTRAVEIAADAARLRRYAEGSTIFQEGDNGEALYILRDGVVKLAKVDLAGHEKTLALLTPPAFFGEMSLVGTSPRSAAAVAHTDVEAYLLFADEFRRLLERYSRVSLNLTNTLAERLRGMDAEAQIFAYKDAQGRVAYVLLRLDRDGVVEIEEDGTPVVHLTHQELASLAGTSRETVTRALKALEAHGVIETQPKEIRLVDPRGLEEILHEIN